jgi:peptide chain release factor 2
VFQELAREKRTVDSWREIEKGITDLIELAALAGDDPTLQDEIEQETQALAHRLDAQERELRLRGPYDSRNALLALHAGAGGTESQDWVSMLLRMYLRWAEMRGYQAEVLEMTAGDEAGIKSVLVEVRGDYAYGYLRAEHGVHRLVRLSPFDAAHARHTSFAQAEVMPEAEATLDTNIPQDEMKIETFRSSGPGGQHMQKTSSAVRITHIPTGITVACQGERSQYQNREVAMRILQARLLEHELQLQAEERAKLKGKHLPAAWGNQIRSYVLHPYKMVKDHRTGHETSNATAVLDGEIDDFIEAQLRSQISVD